MKIAAISHKVKEGDSTSLFLKKLENYMPEQFDIIAGPDYALSKNIPYSKAERNNILNKISKLSLRNKDKLIIPGTMPWEMNDYEVALSCPIFLNGRIIQEFFKETDCGESKLARTVNKTYHRGDSNLNYLRFKDKNIVIEICSDHGKQHIPTDTDLEIILANDFKAGFYLNTQNTKPSRYVLVCDSYHPKIEFIQLSEDRNLKMINCKKSERYLEIFEIE